MNQPTFKSDQLASLRAEGVTAAEIARLEAILPALRHIRTQPPAMRDVRDELTGLGRELTAMKARLDRFKRPPEGMRALAEASARAQAAGTGVEMPDALAALEKLAALVDGAIADLPTEQRRYQRASPKLIRLILRALWEGWGDVNMKVSDTSDQPLWEWPEQEPFPPQPSREQSFVIIAKTCFEALGDGADSEPTRAIRNYIKNEKRRRSGLS